MPKTPPAETTIVEGDLAAYAADVIVNSANTWLRDRPGDHSVFGCLLAAAGPSLERELRAVEVPLGIGSIAVTAGHDLPATHVVHVATHGSPEEEEATGLDPVTLRLEAIGDGVEAALAAADERDAETIALPLLGTGTLGFARQLALETMAGAIRSALQRCQHLRQVAIVVPPGSSDQSALARVLVGTASVDDAGDSLFSASGAAAGAALGTAISPVVGTFVGGALGAVAGPLFGRRVKRAVRASRQRGLARGKDTRLLDTGDPVVRLRVENRNLRERVAALESEAVELRTLVNAESDRVDVSRLALPAAYAVRMAESETSPALRVDNLCGALGTVLRYVASILLADYEAGGAPDNDANAWLTEVFRRPLTDGTWLKVARKVSRTAFDREDRFFAETPWVLLKTRKRWTPLGGRLRDLVDLRNEMRHSEGRFDKSSAKTWLDKALPLWTEVLEGLRPLLSYPLVAVEEIVDFTDDEPRRIVYDVRWLVGDSIMPLAEYVEWEEQLRPERLFLAAPDLSRFLPVAPFIAYRPCQITRSKETCGLECLQGDEIRFATFRFPHREAASESTPRCLSGGSSDGS